MAVVDCGGVNAAAAQLGIAKSAVSRRLGELEARLGTRLIERTTRSFELTAVGRDYHRRAGEILASLAALDRSLGAEAAEAASITVIVEAGLSAWLLMPSVAAFQFRHDAIPVRITAEQDGNAETADVVISMTARRDRESRPIGSFRNLLCASPAYVEAHGAPTSAADLAGHPGVVAASSGGWELAARAEARPREILVVDRVEDALVAAACGIGLALLPDFVARATVERGELVSLLEGETCTPVTVNASYARNAPIAVRLLVDALAGQLPLEG